MLLGLSSLDIFCLMVLGTSEKKGGGGKKGGTDDLKKKGGRHKRGGAKRGVRTLIETMAINQHQ